MNIVRRYATRLPRPRRGTVGTAVKLAVACVVVGLVLGALDVNPIALWIGLWRAASEGVRDALDLGTGWLAVTFAAMATGAVIVLPLWLLRRLLSRR